MTAPRPILTVIVDTEEEFDWSAGFRRDALEVGHLRKIGRFQRQGSDFGVRPAYLVTYPVVSRPEGYEELQRLAAQNEAVIGAHLHPWNTPPAVEALNRRNSYPGNLDPALEREKLQVLTERIRAVFAQEPKVYKAGRYGIGPNSHAILEELGYEVDTSPSPPMDYRTDGGPDFSAWPLAPSWAGAARRLLVLPCTGAFTGVLGPHGRAIYPHAAGPWGRRLRLPGVLSRLGLLDRLRLTPEGYSLEDLKRVTRYCYGRGTRIFSFNLHSSTIRPGAGPYVRSEGELERFLAVIRGYYRFFFEELGGLYRDPTAIRAMLLAERAGESGGA